MQNEKKYFLSPDSMLDSDSADFAVSPNAWVNSENVRTGSTDAGVIGTVESVGSTLLLSSPAPGQNYIAIGSAEDVENSRFVTFYYDTMGLNDKIECFYTDTNTTYVALYSSQVTRGLNFSKNSVIHSAKITNNLLSWVDGTNNEPRKINLESAIKANNAGFVTTAQPYTFPLAFSEITMIKPPPSYTPNILKDIDTAFVNNFIATQSFEFSYQYVYYDYEITVPGAYSQGSRLNFPSSVLNRIVVTMDSNEKIPSTVRLVNLVARISNGTQEGGNSAFVVKTWDKENAVQLAEIESQNLSNGNPLSYNFYNDISGQYLATDDVLRPFDNVPIYSQTHEVAKNRYFLGNNTEGYNVPTTSSLLCSLPNSIYLNSGSFNSLLSILKIETQCHPTSDKWAFSGYFIWDTLTVNNITQTGYFEILPSSLYYGGNCNTGPLGPAPTTTSTNELIYRGQNTNQIVASIRSYYGGISSTYKFGFPQFYQTSPLNGGIKYVAVTRVPGAFYNIFPQLSKYKMGVVFYDYAMRKCGVANNTNQETRLMYTTTTTIKGVAPHRLNFTIIENVVSFMLPGDIIVVSGGSSLDGTYNVTQISPVFDYIQVLETIATTLGYEACTVEVYRLFSNSVTTPDRDFNYYYAIPFINWELSNDNAINEIPSWACYYSIVRTLNLRTRFLIQSYSPTNKAKYAIRNTDGTYSYTNTVFSSAAVALAIPTDALIQAGLGYVYTEGDICILRQQVEEQLIELPVIGQDQNFILVKAYNLGNLATVEPFVYEIYTPYKASEQEPYYEIGEIYGVNAPGTPVREYAQTTGILAPDSYVFNRNIGNSVYLANAMSPNDLFYKRWDSDAGKSNFITKLGQAKAITTISWSDVIVSGTQVNGSSTFRLGSSTRVPDDCGSINKLQLTSKVQSEGTVMLSICTAETNSMYLGETQITDSTGGTQFFSASTNVISTINTLKGSFGTINPEGVVEFRGSVYYPDANRGVWVQYSSNGLFPISSYRMTRFWKLFFAQYTSMTVGEIEALGSRPYIFATMDASHMELVISIPKLLETPPKGYLPDYPEMVYPFDIWDGQGKTIVYNLETAILPQPHWQGSYSFNPEWFVSLSNKLYSLKDGKLYIHNQTDSYNNFYGTQYSSKIMVIANQLPTKPKTYNNVSVESNKVPDFVYFYNDYPYIQTSDLIATDFRDLEGVFYATLFRNKIIPTNSGFTTDGLLIGEYMRNVAMKVLFQFEAIDTPLELKYLNVGYTLSRGHTV